MEKNVKLTRKYLFLASLALIVSCILFMYNKTIINRFNKVINEPEKGKWSVKLGESYRLEITENEQL